MESASGAVKGECFESVLELSSSAGNGGESASGAVKGGSALVVVLSSVFFSGGRGPVSFRGCEGGMGASQLWSCLLLRGMEASQLPGLGGMF